jgi:hypothetical protein
LLKNISDRPEGSLSELSNPSTGTLAAIASERSALPPCTEQELGSWYNKYILFDMARMYSIQ